MAPRNTPSYDQGESVLCFHGPVLYEAKVREVRQEDPKDKKSDWEYFVHYQGWKGSWDEWIRDGRMRKRSEENRELMRKQHAAVKNSQKQANEAKKAAKRPSKVVENGKRKSKVGEDMSSARGSEERHSSVPAPAPLRGTKRARDWELEREETFLAKPAIRIPLPDLLKSMLVDDWEWITKDTKLVPIPHAHPVTSVLADYLAVESPRRRPGSPEADRLEEVVQGVREYFDKSLGRILLYRFERQQWFEVSTKINKDPTDVGAVRTVTIPAVEEGQDDQVVSLNLAGKAPSEIYGVEHLCRLFVSMPEMIAQTNMDAQSVGVLREELMRLTSWLGKNWKRFEARAYVDPGDVYREKARGMN